MIQFVLHWLAIHTGTDAPGDKFYNFWSGFGSDIQQNVTLTVGAAVLYIRHNCHTRGCWRIGRYPVEGTPYRVCKHCHPVIDKAPTRTQLKESHERNTSVSSTVTVLPDPHGRNFYLVDEGPSNRSR